MHVLDLLLARGIGASVVQTNRAGAGHEIKDGRPVVHGPFPEQPRAAILADWSRRRPNCAAHWLSIRAINWLPANRV